MTEVPTLAALIGLDWADAHHDFSLCEGDDAPVEQGQLSHTPAALADWVRELQRRYPGQRVGIAVETSRGPLVYALLEHAHVVLYPINPRSLQRFREAFAPSGAKADLPDADLLREILLKHRHRLRPWTPDDPATRTVRRLAETRRKLVDARSKCLQRLTATLKEYFPQALDWAGTELSSPWRARSYAGGPPSRRCSAHGRRRCGASTPRTIVDAQR